MNSNLENSLAKILGGNVRIFTTSCIYKELKSLKLFHLLENYKNYELKFCSHKNNTQVSGAECIKSIIGTENKLKFGVATQDKELRRELANVPGVPLIYTNRSVYILEPPSSSSLEFLEKREAEKYSSHLSVQDSVVENSVVRKKKKQPNPLSVKKKVLKPSEKSVEKSARKRKRRKFIENSSE
jgi:U3 small nucleolar RNA-associated protein 23